MWFIQNQYEAEKDAILASLKGADEKLMGERERQAALFKLRREKRMLQREDKFESAAIIFNMAEQNRKVQDTRSVFNLTNIIDQQIPTKLANILDQITSDSLISELRCNWPLRLSQTCKEIR